MSDSLSHTLLTRVGSAQPDDVLVQGRVSADFMVNGESLLRALVQANGGHSDFMGCFVAGHPDFNQRSANELLMKSKPNADGTGALLYICPECGDIACGAYSVRVRREATAYVWSDFAYVNGYEASRPIHDVGPFTFSAVQYEHAIASASAL